MSKKNNNNFGSPVMSGVCLYRSELRGCLGVCRGMSAMQKSSTVNFPSFFSAPMMAITLPENTVSQQSITIEKHEKIETDQSC